MDERNEVRRQNAKIFFENLSDEFIKPNLTGSCSYALVLILRSKNIKLRDAIEDLLRRLGVEFRRGLSGGGNQLRQPYLKGYGYDEKRLAREFPNTEHVHSFGWYIGNYIDLEKWKIIHLCNELNALVGDTNV